ncbi:MAG: hypothetical protein MR421_03040, partial [Prevotella sp.]|nr:hypothetical protein [Prevotella sp.]
MKKRQLDEAQAECASSAALTAWQTINWVSCEKEVRKLQVRIVEALKAQMQCITAHRADYLEREIINRITRAVCGESRMHGS